MPAKQREMLLFLAPESLLDWVNSSLLGRSAFGSESNDSLLQNRLQMWNLYRTWFGLGFFHGFGGMYYNGGG